MSDIRDRIAAALLRRFGWWVFYDRVPVSAWWTKCGADSQADRLSRVPGDLEVHRYGWGSDE